MSHDTVVMFWVSDHDSLDWDLDREINHTCTVREEGDYRKNY